MRIAAELRELLRAWPFDINPNQRAEKARLLEWCQEFEAPGDVDFAAFLAMMTRLDLKLPKVPRSVSPLMKEFRQRLDRLTTAAVDRHAAPFRGMIFDVLARFDEAYRERKNELSRVDFNDLERHAIALLKNDHEVRRRVHAQFRQVMLDEFQDINGQQDELIRLLRAEDVFFGVGDVNQSIYGFRHARPEIFRQYRDDVVFRARHSVDLLDNFRSRQSILHFVRAVLAGAEGIEDRDLVSGAAFAGKTSRPSRSWNSATNPTIKTPRTPRASGRRNGSPIGFRHFAAVCNSARPGKHARRNSGISPCFAGTVIPCRRFWTRSIVRASLMSAAGVSRIWSRARVSI
jgi:ATP-dependent exoDNAse (exonuclease V) beta subunit